MILTSRLAATRSATKEKDLAKDGKTLRLKKL